MSAKGEKVEYPWNQCLSRRLFRLLGGGWAAESGQRNYQYHIQSLDDQVTALLPGKFSLGFSLAVNTFRKLTGKSPVRHNKKFESKYDYVDSVVMLHQRMVSDHVSENSGEF